MIQELLLFFGVGLVAMVIRLPVMLAVLLATCVYALVFPVMPSVVLVQTLMQGISNPVLTVIPFFFLVGAIMNAGGMTQRLIRLARAVMGQFRGGLAQVNIGASVIFGGISGSAVADASAVGSIMIPAMQRDGYRPAYSAAVTASSATIGLLIPPSIPMVLFGLFNDVSIGALFLAGLLPGLLLSGYLFAVAAVMARRHGHKAHPWVGWSEVLDSLQDCLFALLLPVLLVSAIVFGIGTITEVAAVAVAYAVLVSRYVYRDVTFGQLWNAVCDTALDCARILSIIAVAGAGVWIVGNMGAANALSASLIDLKWSPTALLALVAVGLVLIGTVVGSGIKMVLIVPMIVPTLVDSGLDVLQVGVVCVLANSIGLITPPVGILIFLTASQARTEVLRVARALLPFIAAQIVLMLMLIMLPSLSTALPTWLL